MCGTPAKPRSDGPNLNARAVASDSHPSVPRNEEDFGNCARSSEQQSDSIGPRWHDVDTILSIPTRVLFRGRSSGRSVRRPARRPRLREASRRARRPLEATCMPCRPQPAPAGRGHDVRLGAVPSPLRALFRTFRLSWHWYQQGLTDHSREAIQHVDKARSKRRDGTVLPKMFSILPC